MFPSTTLGLNTHIGAPQRGAEANVGVSIKLPDRSCSLVASASVRLQLLHSVCVSLGECTSLSVSLCVSLRVSSLSGLLVPVTADFYQSCCSGQGGAGVSGEGGGGGGQA